METKRICNGEKKCYRALIWLPLAPWLMTMMIR